jgi:hypothetical protein
MLLLGPCTQNNYVVSIKRVTPKGSFRITVPKATQQPYHFICPHHISVVEFFDEPKKIERMENGKNRVKMVVRMEVKIS